MSVNPGFGGQKFIPSSLEKLKLLRRKIDEAGLATVVEVDGGVKPDNAREIAAAGADILVMGSAFFNSGDYAATMEKMNGLLGNTPSL
jgi:ribulose-phosphate 3-epimerase